MPADENWTGLAVNHHETPDRSFAQHSYMLSVYLYSTEKKDIETQPGFEPGSSECRCMIPSSLGVTAQSRTQVFHSGFVWQLWRTKSGTGSITVHNSERNTQILLKKKVYKCNRKLQFGHRTFSYSHIVLYVVCSSKLFLCGMTSFLTCPLPGSGCHSSLWLSQSH